MNELTQGQYRPIEEIVRGCKYPYQRMADDISSVVRRGLDNKYVQAGLGALIVGSAALIAAEPAYAQEAVSAAKEYGFFSGMWDGFVVGPNIIMDLLGAESTWACDGAGIRSEPNTGLGYWLGFLMTGGAEGTFLSGVIGGRGD